MEHKQTNISLPGYYICNAASRQQDFNPEADQELTYKKRGGHKDDMEMCVSQKGCLSVLQPEASDKNKMETSKTSSETRLARAGDQAESQCFCQTGNTPSS